MDKENSPLRFKETSHLLSLGHQEQKLNWAIWQGKKVQH